jgi:bifunctional enzyme CysN/CysC
MIRGTGFADQFEATIVWEESEPFLPGRKYVLAFDGYTIPVTVAPLKYRLDPGTEGRIAATKLEFGQQGVVELGLDQQIPFLGARQTFDLLDQLSLELVAKGTINFALRRGENLHWQATDVDKQARASSKGQQPCLVWLTGLSGAGKSTIANLLERKLYSIGHHTYLLDGDNVRHGLNRDLGFTAADRVENIRRVGEVAKLMVDAGLIVIASFISPYRSERHTVRGLFDEGEFFEVFVDAPLAVAEERDPKGLYAKARRGELVNFTGFDAPYEEPERPELRIATDELTAEEGCELVLETLAAAGVVSHVGVA